jgi:hypothetical protein
MAPEPEDEVTQAERRRILREGTTFHQHAQSQIDDEAGGRFGVIAPRVITGTTPIPKYPAAGTHQSDPVGVEPPLGFSVNDLEPSVGTTRPIEDTGGAAAPSCPSGVEPAPPSSSEQTNE